MLQERGDRALNAFINVTLVIIGICVAYPLWYVIICSFSNPSDIAVGKVFLWPSGFTLQGYVEMFRHTQLWVGYGNTIMYTSCSSAIGLALQLTCAYALSRKNLPGRNWMNFFFLFTMYFSGGMIPAYLLYDSMGLINTRTLLCIGGAFSAWNMIVARSFFMGSIPDSLFDAARIDGCGYLRFFVQVVLPLSGAMVAIIALYNIQSHWNSYMSGLIYLHDSDKFTLQQVIHNIQNMSGELSSEMTDIVDMEQMAMLENRAKLLRYTTVIVAALPMVLFYPFIQRFFVKGVMVGSVKG